MKCLKLYVIAIAMRAVLGCQVGCGGDDTEAAFIEHSYSDVVQRVYKQTH